ncbi:MAG: uroporphyrinogen decarboxylase family protein [Promethearchaeota archaeon]
MNSKERTLATIKGIPDKIPFNPFIMHLAATLANVDYNTEYVRKPEVLVSSQIKCAEQFGIDHINVSTDAFREASAWGVDINWEGHTPTAKKFLNLEDFDSIEPPDLLINDRIINRVKAVKLMKERCKGEQCIVGWIEAPFSEITCLFGVIDVLMISRKVWVDKVKELMDRILPIQLKFAKLQIEAGADIIGVGDSIVSQIGPKKYKDACLEITQKLFSGIKKQVPVLYHTCGNNSGVDREGNDMLKLLGSTGCDVLDIDYQVDMASAKKKIGSKVCLRGNVNTQILGSEHYSSEDVSEEVTKNIEAGKPGGKFMLAAGCESPWSPKDLAFRNLKIMKELNEKYGKY